MSNKITHVELASTQIGASADFYRRLFGWKMETFQPMNYTMTVMEEGDTTVGFSPVSKEYNTKAGEVMVYVDVADIDATIAHARELDAAIYQDKMEIEGIGWMAVIGDPGGNRIGVMQRLPRQEPSA